MQYENTLANALQDIVRKLNLSSAINSGQLDATVFGTKTSNKHPR